MTLWPIYPVMVSLGKILPKLLKVPFESPLETVPPSEGMLGRWGLRHRFHLTGESQEL